jgi:transposase
MGREPSPLKQGRDKMESMKGPRFVGIDVSKDRLDVAIWPSGEAFAINRDEQGLAELGQRLKALDPTMIAMEATGGFETVVAASLAAAGFAVAVVNPAQIRSFANALGKRAKTDPIDAAVIARFADATRPAIRPLPDEKTQMLSALIARRRQLIEMRTAEKLRLGRAPSRPLRKSIERIVKALDRELGCLEGDIDAAVKASPVWREKEGLLSTVPGIGGTIARTLIAGLPELGSLGGKQIAALAGLAPFTRQSGRWQGKSFIEGGRAHVRAALFMGAMVAMRFNPPLKAFRDKLIAAGKPKKAAIVAVARKLVTILNAILRDQRPWQNA